MNENEKFDLWCMVELFGHQKIAGRCTEQNVAGTNMLRVDVPATQKNPPFTRFLSAGAIYAINPVSKEIAQDLANNLEVAPISVWEIKDLLEKEIKRLGKGSDENVDYEENMY